MNTEVEITERLSKIKMLVMDVDGTLTDSSMYYSAAGEELKRFSTRDGMGITLLKKAGILTAIITSENSPIASSRASKLKIDDVILGSHDKSNSFKELAAKFNLNLNQMAYIGDDINDEYVMKIAGFTACPNDSVSIIKNISDYICNANGGYGAVREFAEMILLAQKKEINIHEQW